MGESGLAGMTVTITSNGRKVTMPADEFGDVARRRAARINAGIERSESDMDQERVDGADVPKDDGAQKIIRVYGRLEKITMPTERGKELQLAVVLANNGDNRLALAMMDGASVAIEAVERDETPAAKPTAPGECDDQLPLFDMDGDPEEHEGEGSGEENEEAEELAGVEG